MNNNTSLFTEGATLTSTLKTLWKNEYFQTSVVIGLIVLMVFGFWYGSQLVLNTPYPALAVVTGSMCIPYDGACDGWTHPFTRTLHVGDLIVVQGVNPADLNANYPNSDIIVFHRPGNPDELIVHRIAAEEVVNGTIYFYTKGDGNPVDKWPNPIQPSEYDPWGRVSQDQVVGKVVMRIPWLGQVVLFMRNSLGLPIAIALIILLVFVEFIVPLLKGKKSSEQQSQTRQQT
ncbi:S26 family signal peptidase [Candidatus Bathyarchaeota archaeon A05DMB-2]|jgi:signal peptidase I|nr:S26 family signal peptidase [Candidatus Bathyarchaeota archaeon A05DMB-2]